MPFVPIPLTVKIQLIGSHAGDPRISDFHYRRASFTSPPTSTDLQNLLLGFVNGAQVPESLRQCVAGGTIWTEVKATDIGQVNGAFSNIVFNPPLVAAALGDVMPGGENFAIVKKATVAGRGRNGRIFVPDIAEQFQNDSVITNAFVSLLIDLIISMAISIVEPGYTWTPVIPSRKHGTFWGIAGWVMDTLMDTLRTRQKGKRRHKRRVTST